MTVKDLPGGVVITVDFDLAPSVEVEGALGGPPCIGTGPPGSSDSLDENNTEDGIRYSLRLR
jgi:hypothetical protein